MGEASDVMKIKDFQDTRKTKFSGVPKIALQFFKQRNSTNLRIGGMSSARKPPVNWWNSERQKPRNVIANESMPPVSDGWFLTNPEKCTTYQTLKSRKKRCLRLLA